MPRRVSGSSWWTALGISPHGLQEAWDWPVGGQCLRWQSPCIPVPTPPWGPPPPTPPLPASVPLPWLSLWEYPSTKATEDSPDSLHAFPPSSSFRELSLFPATLLQGSQLLLAQPHPPACSVLEQGPAVRAFPAPPSAWTERGGVGGWGGRGTRGCDQTRRLRLAWGRKSLSHPPLVKWGRGSRPTSASSAAAAGTSAAAACGAGQHPPGAPVPIRSPPQTDA